MTLTHLFASPPPASSSCARPTPSTVPPTASTPRPTPGALNFQGENALDGDGGRFLQAALVAQEIFEVAANAGTLRAFRHVFLWCLCRCGERRDLRFQPLEQPPLGDLQVVLGLKIHPDLRVDSKSRSSAIGRGPIQRSSKRVPLILPRYSRPPALKVISSPRTLPSRAKVLPSVRRVPESI